MSSLYGLRPRRRRHGGKGSPQPSQRGKEGLLRTYRRLVIGRSRSGNRHPEEINPLHAEGPGFPPSLLLFSVGGLPRR